VSFERARRRGSCGGAHFTAVGLATFQPKVIAIPHRVRKNSGRRFNAVRTRAIAHLLRILSLHYALKRRGITQFFPRTRFRVKRLLSTDHFSVDGTLIEAWARARHAVESQGCGWN
jgi:hypothetical protein